MDADDWVSATREGEAYLGTHLRRERRRSERRVSRPRVARAEALLRAVEMLESVMPKGAELILSGHLAYADDVLSGFRNLARRMEDVRA